MRDVPSGEELAAIAAAIILRPFDKLRTQDDMVARRDVTLSLSKGAGRDVTLSPELVEGSKGGRWGLAGRIRLGSAPEARAVMRLPRWSAAGRSDG